MTPTIPVARRVALVNPQWTFEGSSYWACPEPHLPLELLYPQALLQRAGFDATVVDAHLEGLPVDQTLDRAGTFAPDLIVVTTAPSYLFWRCPPPELDVPAAFTRALSGLAPVVAIGPHGSATPSYVLDQLGCWAVIRGEPEGELLDLALGQPGPATVTRDRPSAESRAATADLSRLGPLDYEGYSLELRSHRHHVFWGEGTGAEVEFSRGCPYACSFCNRFYFRGRFRSRPIEHVLQELRTLKSRGMDYVYFIDEVFGLGSCRELIRALAVERPLDFGCQTRIDLWDEAGLDALADAGCVSVEFGLESPFPEGQAMVNKGYSLGANRILELMVHAKARIPWVQGDLVRVPDMGPDLVARTEDWRQEAISRGVWVSEPVEAFPYPGSDLYERLFGPVDAGSWLRAREARQPCAC